jgi:hypothetical protein
VVVNTLAVGKVERSALVEKEAVNVHCIGPVEAVVGSYMSHSLGVLAVESEYKQLADVVAVAEEHIPSTVANNPPKQHTCSLSNTQIALWAAEQHSNTPEAVHNSHSAAVAKAKTSQIAAELKPRTPLRPHHS